MPLPQLKFLNRPLPVLTCTLYLIKNSVRSMNESEEK